LGAAPLALVMNRKKFASLPLRAQEIIRRFSGDWLVGQESVCTDNKVRQTMAQLRASPNRRVVEPSQADMATAQAAFDAAIRDWTAASAHNRELMDKALAERAALRKETAK
jgi:TRAP-type C4-dicarboxylate transport system substrate-binding protein